MKVEIRSRSKDNMSKESDNKKKDWRKWVISKDDPSFFVAISVIIIGIIIAVWIVLPGAVLETEDNDTILVEQKYNGPRHPLTGARVDDRVKPAIFAVMIENTPEARPQDGVEDAFLIYEAPVEAGITRWMALFSADQEVDEIGPVRSARPYYVDWAQGWDALYAHVGGSPEALDIIATRGVYDLNEFYWGSKFWRSRRREAPHNVYTESKRLSAAWDEIVGEEVEYGDRLFKDGCDDCEDGDEVVDEVTVEFKDYLYNVTWTYDEETNRYTREQVGAPHRMRNGEVLMADNIAIMITDIVITDEVGRRRIDTIGTGEALVVQDGQVFDATWKKNKRSEIMRFYIDGEEVVWNAGVTWIEVIEGEMAVVY